MYKKLFAVLFAVGLLFAFTGTSMACWDCGYKDAESHDSATVNAEAGDTWGNNQGHGSHYGYGDAQASQDAWTCGKVTADTEVGAEGYSKGDGWGFDDKYKNGATRGEAGSYADTGVSSFANSDTSWQLFGDPYNRSFVEGSVYQFNFADTEADYHGGDAWVGAGNDSGASYSGVDYGHYCDTDSAVRGRAGAHGSTDMGVYTDGDYSKAWGDTYSNSNACQTGLGNVNAYGTGNVAHGTYATDSNMYGGGIAYTNGDAAYSYNNDGYRGVSGSGAAHTYGVSDVDMHNHGVSTSAYSSSSSWAK